MSNYENNAKVRVSIKKKLGNMGEKSRLVEREIEITDDSPLNMRIEKNIGDKIERALARTGRFIGKYSASKYLGQPISEIKAEERRIDNIITDRQAKLDSFVNEIIDSYKHKAMKNCHWTEERAEEYACNTFRSNIAGSGAEDEKERELHKRYVEMDDELLSYKAEKNALAVAKADYMDQNANLIKEVQEKRRREDLEKSGLLDELGLSEPAPVESEEKEETEINESEEK